MMRRVIGTMTCLQTQVLIKTLAAGQTYMRRQKVAGVLEQVGECLTGYGVAIFKDLQRRTPSAIGNGAGFSTPPASAPLHSTRVRS